MPFILQNDYLAEREQQRHRTQPKPNMTIEFAFTTESIHIKCDMGYGILMLYCAVASFQLRRFERARAGALACALGK